MKTIISIVMCFGVVAFLFVGCGNSESGFDDYGKSTTEEYLLARNIFVDKYNASMGEMRKVISNFDFSEKCWEKYRNLMDELNCISTTFFNNESTVASGNLRDFNKIKEQVKQYYDIICGIEQCRDKSADEQGAIIAESFNKLNKLNFDWKKKADITN